MHTDDDDDDDDDDDVDAVDNDDCTLCTPGCRVSASGAPTSSLQSKCRRLVFFPIPIIITISHKSESSSLLSFRSFRNIKFS